MTAQDYERNSSTRSTHTAGISTHEHETRAKRLAHSTIAENTLKNAGFHHLTFSCFPEDESNFLVVRVSRKNQDVNCAEIRWDKTQHEYHAFFMPVYAAYSSLSIAELKEILTGMVALTELQKEFR